MSYYYDTNGIYRDEYSRAVFPKPGGGKSTMMPSQSSRSKGTKSSSVSTVSRHPTTTTTTTNTTSSSSNVQCKALPNVLRIADLDGMCQDVEEAISNRLKRETEVVEKAKQFRAAIHKDVNKLIEYVRIREENLLNIIDEVENFHLTKLKEDCKKSYEMLGQLKHAIRCAQDCVNTVASLDLEDLEIASTYVSNAPDEKFTYFSSLVENYQAIAQFGIVKAPPNALKVSASSKNVDNEQRLLFETLEKLTLTAKEFLNKVCIEFPKLSSKKEDWLQNGGSELTVETTMEPKFILPGYLLVTGSDSWLKGSQNVALPDVDNVTPVTWLLQRNDESSNDDKTDGCSSCSSESIEMVSTSDSVESDGFTCLEDPINSIRSCRGNWLVETKQQKGAANYDRKTNCDATMDIENLGDKESWLLVNRGESSLQIGDFCRANETCRAFSDCVCDVSCQERAQKWVDTIEVSKNKNTNSQVSWDRMEWLKNSTMMGVTSSQQKDNNKWLKVDEAEKMDVSEKQNVDAATSLVTKKSVVSFFGNDRSYNWLKNSSNFDTECKIPNDFKVYFQNPDTKQWLVS